MDFRDMVIVCLLSIIISLTLGISEDIEECKHKNNAHECELIAVPVEIDE